MVHFFKKIPSNLWVVCIGSNSFQEISHAGKPQIVSRYILSNLWSKRVEKEKKIKRSFFPFQNKTESENKTWTEWRNFSGEKQDELSIKKFGINFSDVFDQLLIQTLDNTQKAVELYHVNSSLVINVIKWFFLSLMTMPNKLKCLYLAITLQQLFCKGQTH